jgi:hypothetical protein
MNYVSGSATEPRILNTYFHLCGGSYKEEGIANAVHLLTKAENIT